MLYNHGIQLELQVGKRNNKNQVNVQVHVKITTQTMLFAWIFNFKQATTDAQNTVTVILSCLCKKVTSFVLRIKGNHEYGDGYDVPIVKCSVSYSYKFAIFRQDACVLLLLRQKNLYFFSTALPVISLLTQCSDVYQMPGYNNLTNL